MFFNSATFLFGFLPIVLAGYFLLEKSGNLVWRQAWLLAASLVFYAWGNATVLALFLPLTLVNYLFGTRLQRCGESGGSARSCASSGRTQPRSGTVARSKTGSRCTSVRPASASARRWSMPRAPACVKAR